DSLMAELKLAREIGFNGVFSDLGRLESERAKLGPEYGSVHPRYFPNNLNFNYRFTNEIRDLIAKNKPDFEKIKIPTIVDLADEPRFSEIPKSPALDADFVEWMKKKNLTPADAGVKDWSEVKAIAPNPEMKRLSTFSRQFQMQEVTGFWNGMATEIVAMNPLLKPTINWQCNEAYEGITIDEWEVYRQPGLGMVWGEDWYEYNPVGSGVTAWYAEIMRSQAKYRNLPLGSYPIFGYGGGYAQPVSLFKAYERMMRGGSVFDFYPYSTIGNEGGWTDNPKNAVFLAKICRDMAAVEDIVVDGSVLPAHAAIVYQTSCMLWDRGAYANAMALYLAYLHSGIPVDVITEQDVMDGYAKGYSMLFLTGSNIRKDVLDKVDQFVKEGGTLVSSMPDVRNQFDEPIADGAQSLGLTELARIKNDPIGSYVYGLSTMKPLDTVSWDGKEVKVYGQKSKMTPSADASVLAKFSDGAPALVKTPHGKGTIYQYAFSPWASYVRADYSTPKGPNKGLATILARNNTERQLCLLPLAKTPAITTYSEPMIGGRIMVGKDAALVGMVDYGCGKRGRETPNPIFTDFDFDTEPPFPITVIIQCKKKPKTVTSVRSGNISWKYANGKVTAQVPLRGADMLILKGKDLF
ncbi:MAG: beta-galactosidase trimerization domain-containing protein, partial [Chthoniobacterales bacterium]